jgi:hypothetical protein
LERRRNSVKRERKEDKSENIENDGDKGREK